jgi:uncharacterized membrane protein YccC
MSPEGRHPIRLCDHPRANRQIELARGWTGIGAFACVVLLSHDAGSAWFAAGCRGLLAGIVGYVAAWGLGVMVWRHLALAEAEAARESAEARRAALLEEIERRAGGLPSQAANG